MVPILGLIGICFQVVHTKKNRQWLALSDRAASNAVIVESDSKENVPESSPCQIGPLLTKILKNHAKSLKSRNVTQLQYGYSADGVKSNLENKLISGRNLRGTTFRVVIDSGEGLSATTFQLEIFEQLLYSVYACLETIWSECTRSNVTSRNNFQIKKLLNRGLYSELRDAHAPLVKH